MTPAFWQGKRVFVTGHSGFKGSWLSIWLQMLNAKVYGYSLAPPSTPNLFACVGVARNMTSEEADVRDRDRLVAAMSEFQPEIVFHLAAQSLVRKSYAEPVLTYATNVMGTVNVLDAVRVVPGVRAAIIVTSDKCYRNEEPTRACIEGDEMGGHDPYSSSKGCVELVTSAYRRSFFDTRAGDGHVAVASARAGNVIGGGDWAEDRLLPDMMRAFAREEEVSLRSPQAIRPWQHVLEPLSGYLLLAEKMCSDPVYAGGWNFGPEAEDARPVQWVADRVVERWGDGAGWCTDEGAHPHEAHTLMLDCSKAQRELGWSPRTSLDTGLSMTVDWYKAFTGGQSMLELTQTQITRFQALAS